MYVTLINTKMAKSRNVLKCQLHDLLHSVGVMRHAVFFVNFYFLTNLEATCFSSNIDGIGHSLNLCHEDPKFRSQDQVLSSFI